MSSETAGKTAGRRVRRRPTRSRGSELLEFAIVLPLLLLLVAGIWDFGSAFLLKTRMTNAAREGTRVAVSTPLRTADCQGATPCSIVVAADAVKQYMTLAGNDASCLTPDAPSAFVAPAQATYTCRNGTSLVIDRASAITTPTGTIPATRVTLTYPVHWTMLGKLLGGTLPQSLSTTVTMQNLT